MIQEYAIIELHCDIKSCPNYVSVTKANRDACNLALYEKGWRMQRYRQLCPQHAFQLSTRMEADN